MFTTTVIFGAIALVLAAALFLTLASVSAIAKRIKSLELDKSEIVKQVQAESQKTASLMGAFGLLPPPSATRGDSSALGLHGGTATLGFLSPSDIGDALSKLRSDIGSLFGGSLSATRLVKAEQAIVQARGVADSAAATAAAAKAISDQTDKYLAELAKRVSNAEQLVEAVRGAAADMSAKSAAVDMFGARVDEHAAKLATMEAAVLQIQATQVAHAQSIEANTQTVSAIGPQIQQLPTAVEAVTRGLVDGISTQIIELRAQLAEARAKLGIGG